MSQPVHPSVPANPGGAAIAAEMLSLARRVRRLPPPSHRHPERFTEEKDEIAAALERLVRRLTRAVAQERPKRPPLPGRRARRGHDAAPSYIMVGSRRIMVQARRPGFALG